MAEITELLARVSAGDLPARSMLAEAVYDELHRLAARLMNRERSGNSLQPTVLVHDAYMALVGQKETNWANRAHFYSVAAQCMRRILIDHARHVHAEKRGGGLRKIELDENLHIGTNHSADLLVIDDALQRLAQVDARMAQIVELRFFAGMTEEEIATVLGLSPRTIKRDWSFARTWLHAELSANGE